MRRSRASCGAASAYDQAYQPAWSPDGTRIAFSAWLTNGYRDILVIDVATGAVDSITSDRAIDMEPAWSHDGRYLYFDSDRTGISNIYAFDTARALGTCGRVTNVLGGAFHARKPVARWHERLAYRGRGAGLERRLRSVRDRARSGDAWLPARDVPRRQAAAAPQIPDRRSTGVAAPCVSRARDARSRRRPGPASRSPIARATHGAASRPVALRTSFGLHNYVARGRAVDADADKDTNIGASYGYTGWRPSVPGLRRADAGRPRAGGGSTGKSTATYQEED